MIKMRDILNENSNKILKTNKNGIKIIIIHDKDDISNVYLQGILNSYLKDKYGSDSLKDKFEYMKRIGVSEININMIDGTINIKKQ